ncbi:MAG: hypothetical protein RI580_05975 [Halothece sp. Uz-M2-17]|nr:hypothetical protein [Halothece sp. Uz-M2-17]
MQKLYLKLLNSSYFSKKKYAEANQGFVLPMIIALGLIMTVVGLTIVARSSDNKATAVSKKQSAQSLAVAETGVTELMQFINTVRPLADNDLSEWSVEYEAIRATCADSFTNSTAQNYADASTWITTNNGKDRFRVLDYDYTADDPTNINSPGVGVLTIEGEANFNQNTSTSAVEVNIPVSPRTQGTPGLFVTQANLSNNQIDGDLLLYDCDFSGSNIDLSNINGEATANPFAKFPPLPEPPSDSTKVNDLNNGIGSSLFSGGVSTVTLPRSGDVQADDGVYHYVLGTTGANSIDLKGGGKTLIIDPSKKVTFYMEGNVQMKGNAKLIHDCTGVTGCKPTDFQIYGSDGSSDTYGTGTETTAICLSGGSTVDAFILAPNANVAVNGGGNNTASDGTNDESGEGITGSVWANSWNDDPNANNCGSNAGKTLVTQNADWNELPIAAPRQIAPASNWKRQSAN